MSMVTLGAAAVTEARQWGVLKTRVAANYAKMRADGIGITTAPLPDYPGLGAAAGLKMSQKRT